MKYLIIIMLTFPSMALANLCSPANSDHMIDTSWNKPTHRERNNEGIEKALPLSEIKGYVLTWKDDDAENSPTCRTEININTAESYSIKGQAGTKHKIQIQTVDTGGRTSSYSAAIYKTTDGTKPSAPPTNAPASKITTMKVESR